MSSAGINGNYLVATVYTVVFGGITTLLILRYLLQAFLGANPSITLMGKHCLVTGGSSGIGKEVAKV